MFDQRQFPGNIRSVNVDYLNNNNTNDNNKSNNGDEFTYNEAKNHYLNVQENKQTNQVHSDRLPRLQKSTETTTLPRFTAESLEAAILDSLVKLKQVKELNSIINVRSLVEHLASSSSANLVNYHLLRDSKSIDYTIKSLAKSGRLCLSELPDNKQKSLTKTAQQQLENHEAQLESVFLDQLISLPDNNGNVQATTTTIPHDHHHNHLTSSRHSAISGRSSSGNSSRISTSNDTENYREPLSGERTSRLFSSTNTSTTTKSKSTTLDSGIQSWDQLLSDVSPANRDYLATDTAGMIMYSASSVVGDRLATRNQQQQRRRQLEQKQVVEQDPSSFANHKTTTINICDTTEALQHQHQPRRLARRCKQVEKAASKRGFSLGRSFSFRSKRMNPTLNGVETDQQNQKQQQRSEKIPLDKWTTNNMQESDDKTECLGKEKRGQNLSSLFRSKSMRIIPTSRSSQLKMKQQQQQHSRGILDDNYDAYEMRTRNARDTHHPQRQATIDYLANAQHKRSFSIRRNSLLTFNTKDANESSGGKIVLFLRKLFNMKRSRQQLQHADENNDDNTMRSNARTSPVENHSRTNNGYANNGDNFQSIFNGFGSRRNNQEKVSSETQTYNDTNRMVLAETSRSSNSSSASSSLIEILDCSRISDNSRRPFKETPASNLIELNNKQRATTCWTSLRRPSTIRRSDSSLSHNSEASCSTTKSTVSQQLRRHLDEAYKRHRICSSQQEREFIDSINVLRQASRHALPAKLSSSRSSSKNRHQINNKSMTSSSTKSASTLNDDASINSSSYCATRSSSNSRANRENNNDRSIAKCNCNHKHQDDQYFDDVGTTLRIENNNHTNAIHERQNYNQSPQDLDLIHKSSAREPLSPIGNTFDLKQQQHQLNNFDYEFAAPSLNEDPAAAARISNCCVCNSYLNSAARLCSLTCFPASSGIAANSPTQTSCCLSPNMHHQQHMKQTLGSELHQAQKMLPTGEVANEFCCPLWQSMLYNYCPPFYLTNSQPFAEQTALQLTQTSMMMPEQQQQQQQQHVVQEQQHPQLNRLENFSSQHKLQQHQHNTTIDLKIEIAPAEFGKMKKLRKNKEGRGKVKLRDNGEETNDDSLDSSRSLSSRSRSTSTSASASTSTSASVTDDSSVVCEIEANQAREVVKDDQESPISSLLHNDEQQQLHNNHHHLHHASCQPVESEFERDSCESNSTNDHFSTRFKSDSLEAQGEEQQGGEQHNI